MNSQKHINIYPRSPLPQQICPKVLRNQQNRQDFHDGKSFAVGIKLVSECPSFATRLRILFGALGIVVIA
jgi:hypothetical protein